jgi:hypothetical protein
MDRLRDQWFDEHPDGAFKAYRLKTPDDLRPKRKPGPSGGERRNTKQIRRDKKKEKREEREEGERERDPPLPPSNNHLSLLPSIATKALQVLVLVGVKDGRKNKS